MRYEAAWQDPSFGVPGGGGARSGCGSVCGCGGPAAAHSRDRDHPQVAPCRWRQLAVPNLGDSFAYRHPLPRESAAKEARVNGPGLASWVAL
jgi:hypothetical protein